MRSLADRRRNMTLSPGPEGHIRDSDPKYRIHQCLRQFASRILRCRNTEFGSSCTSARETVSQIEWTTELSTRCGVSSLTGETAAMRRPVRAVLPWGEESPRDSFGGCSFLHGGRVGIERVAEMADAENVVPRAAGEGDRVLAVGCGCADFQRPSCSAALSKRSAW